MFCVKRCKNIYRLKENYWKYENYKKWRQVSEEAGENGVGGSQRRIRVGITVCELPVSKLNACPMVSASL